MNKFEKVIKTYLDDFASKDAEFSNKYAEKVAKLGGIDAVIKQCCNYICREVNKSRRPSIRVALRHKYLPKDARTWLDHLYLLEQRNQDLRNPAIICPKDLKKAHQAEVEIENRRRERRRAEMDRRMAEEEIQRQEELLHKLTADGKAQIEYVKRMGNMLGVVVKVSDIELKLLQSIQEFYEEGKAMHHCVFTNKYYEHKDTLILSAKVKGERTETVEVCTRTWKIRQCRGIHNGQSKYHDAIVKVVEMNMNAFRSLA